VKIFVTGGTSYMGNKMPTIEVRELKRVNIKYEMSLLKTHLRALYFIVAG